MTSSRQFPSRQSSVRVLPSEFSPRQSSPPFRQSSPSEFHPFRQNPVRVPSSVRVPPFSSEQRLVCRQSSTLFVRTTPRLPSSIMRCQEDSASSRPKALSSRSRPAPSRAACCFHPAASSTPSSSSGGTSQTDECEAISCEKAGTSSGTSSGVRPEFRVLLSDCSEQDSRQQYDTAHYGRCDDRSGFLTQEA